MNNLDSHYKPSNFSDKVALSFTKFLRFLADTFFKKRYGHRAVVLETVAALCPYLFLKKVSARNLKNFVKDKATLSLKLLGL